MQLFCRRKLWMVAGLMTTSLISSSLELKGAEASGNISSKAILEERKVLDKTVWADEVEAQEYETAFIKLWDEERSAAGAKKMEVLTNFLIKGNLTLGSPSSPDSREAGISVTKYGDAQTQAFNEDQRKKLAQSLLDSGIEIIQTEWHHSRFVPASESSPPKSTVSFTIHAVQASTQKKFEAKGDIEVTWAVKTEGETVGPVADSVAVTGLKLQQRMGGGGFTEFKSFNFGRGDWISGYPLLVYDLNHDGRSDVIFPRWNSIYRSTGNRRFRRIKLLDHPIDIWEAAIFSDFNNDGNADLVTVGKDGLPYFYDGTENGRFPNKPVVCAEKIHFDLPLAMTAGDVDGDGDLDLWMTQYKLSFMNGQMPTPFYDANDGYPSYFLLNDGKGNFTDATESAGLASLRYRRTYSTSFIDLDDDGDLDLINVSDYAGLDIYRNDGKGKFELATDSYVDDRHFFGMGHTFGDYNQDGYLDFYVIGMSSTTARRLDRLNLGRADRPDVHPMRAAMGYGNRLYLGTESHRFREDEKVAKAVARTGWSWGVTTFDPDLDGDQDIYVANGHRSGNSCQDYCSTFWRHDIYTGDSDARKNVLEVFQVTLKDINDDKISWNGYEKNVLQLNQRDRPERFMNSSFMFESAYAFDARSVVSDDFDNDGRPDLAIAKSTWNGRGFESSFHLFANDLDTGEKNNWYEVRFREAPGPGYSPNGAKIAITDDLGRTQTRWIVTGDSFLAQHAPVAHFGLGQATKIESIEVTWPGGIKERHQPKSGVNTSVVLRGQNLIE